MERLYIIPNFEKYRVTKTGKIYSIESKIFLKPCLRANKYLIVGLYKTKRNPQTVTIHRIVCSVFHKNPYNKPQVNHKDGNKLNNHYLNLEWVTNRENQIHSVQNGLHNSFHRSKKILDIKTNIVYNSISDYSRKFDIPLWKIYGQYRKGKSSLKYIKQDENY